jgi:hypothetical protein
MNAKSQQYSWTSAYVMDYYVYLKLCVISTFEYEGATLKLLLNLMKSAPPPPKQLLCSLDYSIVDWLIHVKFCGIAEVY